MPDYSKGKIYKLWSPSKNLVYYGSTTQTLSQRLSGHKGNYKLYNKNNTKGSGCSSYLILACEDYKIELLEKYPCNNKSELYKKEGEYIKNNKCVNNQIAGRTKQEYQDQRKQEYQEIKEWKDALEMAGFKKIKKREKFG